MDQVTASVIVSLIVSLVALFGTLCSTWWTNRAADKRLKVSQEREEKRRKEDNDRHEREWRCNLSREDYARQRNAIADFYKNVRKDWHDTQRQVHANREEIQILERKSQTAKVDEKWKEIDRRVTDFYIRGITRNEIFKLEINADSMQKALDDFCASFNGTWVAVQNMQENEREKYKNIIMTGDFVSKPLSDGLNGLISAAKEHLYDEGDLNIAK